MTSEKDFQGVLDKNPGDWQTRLVFADWLDERGDERAAGYRALGVQRVYPRGGNSHCWSRAKETNWCLYRGHEALVDDWFDLTTHKGEPVHAIFRSRRKAEDAAARSFLKLPAERRAYLLSEFVPHPPVPVKPAAPPTAVPETKPAAE